jgi:hypothetical protein
MLPQSFVLRLKVVTAPDPFLQRARLLFASVIELTALLILLD